MFFDNINKSEYESIKRIMNKTGWTFERLYDTYRTLDQRKPVKRLITIKYEDYIQLINKAL